MIKNVDFQKTTEDAFLKYAASVAQERAIPDVREITSNRKFSINTSII